MSPHAPGHAKLLPKLAIPAVLALVLTTGACLDSPTDGGATSVRLELGLSVAAPGVTARSTEAALEKVNRVAVRIRRADDESLVFETEVEADASNDQLVVPLSVELGTGALDALVSVELRSGVDALFAGSAAATLQAGAGDAVQVVVEPIPAGITIEPVDDPVEIGQTLQLQGSVLFATGDAIDGLAPTWSTLDPELVDVTPDGSLTGRARGDARVRATFGALSETVMVVVGRPIVEVAVEPEAATIAPDEQVTYTATALDADGQSIQGEFTISWASSRPDVATIDIDGTATGLSEGTTVITATIEGVVGTADLTVTRPDLLVSSGPPSIPSQIIRGGSVSIEWRVRNDGATAAGFSVGFYLSTDTEITVDDIRLGQASRPGGLGAGAETGGTNTLPVPVDLSCGTYFVGILADDQADVDETDESNNAAASATEIIGCDAPVISNVLPSPAAATGASYAFRGDGTTDATSILFAVDDPDGNLSSVTVDASNSDGQVTTLPLTVTGNQYRADPDGGSGEFTLPDDTYVVTITATDALGLVSTVEISYRLDRSPPNLLNFAPPPTSSGSESGSAELSISSSIFDSAGFRQVTVAIFRDGDGNCSTTGDQTPLAEPGEVDDQSRDVTSDARTANFFDEVFTLFNPIINGSVTIDYCTVLTADDGALSNTGSPLSNRRVVRSPTAFTWFGAAFQ